MRISLIVLAALVPAFAQQQAANQQKEKCIVEGRVISGASGEPVPHAEVVLREQTQVPNPEQGARGYRMETDDAGTFHFEKVEPAKYNLSARKTGYLLGNYGARRIRGPGLPIELASGQSLGSLEIKIYPQAVISGTVTDDRGEPMPASVNLLRRGWTNGKAGLVMAGSTNSDDLGNYRCIGVEPGKYFVRAEVSANMMENGLQQVDREGNPVRAHLVPTFFGDAIAPEAAAPIQVQAGQDVSGTNIKLHRETVFRIQGRLTSVPVGDSPLNYYLFLTARAANVFSTFSQAGRPKRDGQFTIENVPPGDYQLAIARMSAGGVRISVPVQVSGTDIENLEVPIPPPVTLQGRILVEGSDPVDLSTAQLRFIASGGMFGGTAIASENGSFHFDASEREGNLNVQIPGVSAFIKSVKVGGREIPGTHLDLSQGSGPLEVLISLNPGKVEGTVTREDGDSHQAVPATAVSVLLIPETLEENSWDSGIRGGSTDKDGHFSVASLKPGKYKALAEGIDFRQWQDPELAKAFASRSVDVEVEEKETKQIQLKLIAPEELAQVLDRLGL